MFYAKYRDINGEEVEKLYDLPEEYYADTFSPEVDPLTVIDFSVKGKNYRERQSSVQTIAIDFQAAEIAAKMGEGQTITVYQPDEWISNIVHMTTGELESVEPGTWAQYKGVYMTIRTNKKSKRLFFTDSKLAVVVAGLPTITPEEIAWKRTWNSGGAILKEGRDSSEQMRMIADHYKTLAILDTVQR